MKKEQLALAENRGWRRGFFCAVAVLLKQTCHPGISTPDLTSLFKAGGDWKDADPEDVKTFREHGLIP